MSSSFEALSEAVLAAAREFSDDAEPIATLLMQLVADVDRASKERLEIFPVAHHSPASGVHLVRRLRQRAPKVIFIELCEDLRACIADLPDCSLPIALQAFANDASAFDARWAPLSVVAPLTELSAEYQAIAYAHHHPETALVFVDRSVDHVYQWSPEFDPVHDDSADDDGEGASFHGSGIGVQVGSMQPTFSEFHDFLLANARVSHFAEWWATYVEEPTLDADYDSYRRVMFLVGSLIRRLGTRGEDLETDRRRERYMWTRMKTWLAEHNVAPEDALHICGAAHAASDVEEYGADSDVLWDIPPRSETDWLYGLIPSSYSGIERQFGNPRGTISLARETWRKAMKRGRLTPFAIEKKKKGKAKRKAKTKARAKAAKVVTPAAAAAEMVEPNAASSSEALLSYLTLAPSPAEQDREQLLGWCTGIVGLARKNGYLASTADSIAIYENAVLLAQLRARPHPSPYDFIDAAVTCLEKGAVPGKRSVTRLCEIMLGADKIGQVGYSSLPPLVQDVYDRLTPAGVKPGKRTVTRALMDFKKTPAKRACSDLLWRLNYLLPGTRVARPIMGERVLGGEPLQESWDIKLGGPEQRHLIELAYEGVTVEQVLEGRIRKGAHGGGTTTLQALRAAEAAELLLDSPRLCEELGERAVMLLAASTGADDSHDIFDLVRKLVHYYRATPAGLPHWLGDFVATGYRHYATLLPEAFADRGTQPQNVAGMLAFIFTLESLALTLGCNRTQLLIAIENAAPLTVHPEKKGLLWASEWLLDVRDIHAVRAEFSAVLDNRMSMTAYPRYLTGFLLGLEFSKHVAPIGVELLSRAFIELPDAVVMPWLPGLLDALGGRAREVIPSLLKEAQASLPRRLDQLDQWSGPWLEAPPAQPATAEPQLASLSADEAAARTLLFDAPAATNAFAALLGADSDSWIAEPVTPGTSPAEAPAASPEEQAAAQAAAALLSKHDAAMNAHARTLEKP